VDKEQNELLQNKRSFNPEPGERGGSTKNPLKQKVFEEARKHNISKATVQKSWDKARGPAQQHQQHKPNAQGKQQPEEQSGEWSIKKSLDRLRSGEKLSRSQLETENTFLLAKITDLQVELTKAKTDLLLAQMKQVEKYFNAGLQEMDMDWVKWRRYLQKKYHPDVNSGKTFTAGEVMADINPLLRAPGLT
jgi:hypothetical protein